MGKLSQEPGRDAVRMLQMSILLWVPSPEQRVPFHPPYFSRSNSIAFVRPCSSSLSFFPANGAVSLRACIGQGRCCSPSMPPKLAALLWAGLV